MTPLDKTQTKVGFAGLGLMGSAFVQRLAEQGWSVRVWNRSPGKTHSFAAKGIPVDKTPADLAANSDIVLSSLMNDEAAKAVYLGPNGIFSKPKPGLIVLEMSTLTPSVSEELHAKAKSLGIQMLDIPVAGSTPAVKAGAVTLLAGGSKELFDACVPIYESIAKQWFLMGPAGSGARMKLVVNLLLGVGMEAIAESISLGKSLGIDYVTLLSVLSKTAVIGPAFVGKFEKIRTEDYSPQFPLRLMNKDLGLVLKAAEGQNLSLPAAEAAYQITSEVTKEKGDLDLSVITPYVSKTKRGQD
jgi:3-hydroxyisobutyrate dehydrogenase-like beta-hydroxyacid dehydrogenase